LYVLKIPEGSQRPEVMANVVDGSFLDFSLLMGLVSAFTITDGRVFGLCDGFARSDGKFSN
jgi:hypothetical protein